MPRPPEEDRYAHPWAPALCFAFAELCSFKYILINWNHGQAYIHETRLGPAQPRFPKLESFDGGPSGRKMEAEVRVLHPQRSLASVAKIIVIT